jgi:hypothetical protein
MVRGDGHRLFTSMIFPQELLVKGRVDPGRADLVGETPLMEALPQLKSRNHPLGVQEITHA